MTQTRTNTEKLTAFIAQKFQNGELDNDSLVQVIELCGAYLNLQTISAYATANKKSYNGVKKPVKSGRQIITIFGVKFVIDNI